MCPLSSCLCSPAQGPRLAQIFHLHCCPCWAERWTQARDPCDCQHLKGLPSRDKKEQKLRTLWYNSQAKKPSNTAQYLISEWPKGRAGMQQQFFNLSLQTAGLRTPDCISWFEDSSVCQDNYLLHFLLNELLSQQFVYWYFEQVQFKDPQKLVAASCIPQLQHFPLYFKTAICYFYFLIPLFSIKENPLGDFPSCV